MEEDPNKYSIEVGYISCMEVRKQVKIYEGDMSQIEDNGIEWFI